MFEFYEMVRVIDCPDRPHLVGKLGFVDGKSFEDGGPVEAYGVFMFDLNEGYSFKPLELESLGFFVDADSTRSGTSVGVKNVGGEGVITWVREE